MTSPVFHARSSVRHWGGTVEDYLPIHQWFDQTKESFCDVRHRAMRHHAEGIFECERVFGTHITNSDGRDVPVRYIGEQHVKEDCGGRIPSIKDWLCNIPLQRWMSRGYKLSSAEAHEDKINGPESGQSVNWTGVGKGAVRRARGESERTVASGAV